MPQPVIRKRTLDCLPQQVFPRQSLREMHCPLTTGQASRFSQHKTTLALTVLLFHTPSHPSTPKLGGSPLSGAHACHFYTQVYR